MKKKIKVLFTGGGSAGHVTPNLPLMQTLQATDNEVFYVGSENGIERDLVKTFNIPYYTVAAGKLRRYWSWQNFLMPFQLIFGIIQSFLLCCRIKPAIVFSKGGFVALPVVVGAWLRCIPIIIHESDLTPGLANRLSFPFAKLICVTFPRTVQYFKNKKEILITGLPIREFLYQGDVQKGLTFCGFRKEKPVLLVMAGGLGSVAINTRIYQLVPQLIQTFQIVHLCGKGKLSSPQKKFPDYRQFEYLQAELAHVLACTDLVISRAGATSIYELLALKKPHILLPLSKKASRGDQLQNAAYCAEQGLSYVLHLEQFSAQEFLNAILYYYTNLDKVKKRLARLVKLDSTQLIIEKLYAFAKQ